MKWAIDWGPVFPRHIKAIPSVDAATELCKAILQFAETSEGPVTLLQPDNPRRLKIRVVGAVAYLFADERTGTLYVGSAYPRST